MKKTIVSLLALLMTAAMLLGLAACGGSTGSESAPNSDDAGAPAADAPADSQTVSDADAGSPRHLNFGTEGEPTNLGPSGLIGNSAGNFVSYAIYDRLWYMDIEGELHLRLAESYEFDNDANTLTVKLRDGGVFSDGTAITAEDVVFSILRYNSDAKTIGNLAPENTSAVDDRTLTVGFIAGSNNDATIEQLSQVAIISKAYTEDFTNEFNIYTEPLTSGPYMLKESWNTGSAMELVKNPDYWGAGELAYDSITVNFIGEETTRYLSFKAGELDLCYLTESDNIDTAAADGFDVYSHEQQSSCIFVFDTQNCDKFENQNLRLALCYSVDVPAIVESVCGSAYTVATSMLPSSNWAYKDMSYEYNPDKAMEYYNAYVEETGNQTTEFTLVIQEGLSADVAEAMQYYFMQLPGVTMNIDVVDNATFFARLISEVFEVGISVFGGAGEPCVILDQCLSSSMASTPKTPEELQTAIDAACYSNADHTERAAMFAEVQDMFHDFGKMIPLYQTTINFAQSGDIVTAAACTSSNGGSLIPFAIQ